MIWLAEVRAALVAKDLGASGTYCMIALELPTSEVGEVPYALKAVTLTSIFAPSGKLYGTA